MYIHVYVYTYIHMHMKICKYVQIYPYSLIYICIYINTYRGPQISVDFICGTSQGAFMAACYAQRGGCDRTCALVFVFVVYVCFLHVYCLI